MIQSILLINPPSLPGTTANREGTAVMGLTMPSEAAFFYPPQTIAYGVAVLRKAGYTVGALDAVGVQMTIPAVLGHLRRHPADLFVVQAAPKTWNADYLFLDALKRDFPQVPRLLIGTGVRFLPREEWSVVADAVLAGDAEWGLVEAVDALHAGKDAPGLWRPDQPDPPPPVRIPDRPVLPRPAWDALPTDTYPFLSLWGSRGCNDNCRWCPYVIGWGHGRRERPPEEVAEELLWLRETFHKPRHIFRDPVFAANREWVLSFCRTLRTKGDPPPPWEIEDRPEHLTPDVLTEMAAAGCTQVKLGLEVLNPELLIRWGRVPNEGAARAYEQAAADVIDACRRLGILCKTFIVIGVGESEADLVRTEAFIRQHKPHYVSAKRFVLYPGVQPVEVSPLPESVLQRWAERLNRISYPMHLSLWRQVLRWVRR